MANPDAKTSSSNLADSAVQARLRDKLNIEGIKLWINPFYNEDQKSVNDNEIMALAGRYATELELPESDVTECIFTLQRNAIERLAEREIFKTTGLATIRLRYSGFQSEKVKSEATNRLQVNLSETTGKQLKSEIGKMISVHENRLKLISAGRVIDENGTLEHQNVRNGGQIMVLSVAGDHETLQEVEEQFRELEETKSSADFLSDQDGTDGLYSLQVADQSGKPLNLPEIERKTLAVALALHEKGRAALKTEHFSKSLVFLLEADTFYSQCQSSLLEMVDNYGLLNLDIAWCYLSLQSIAELPQVEARLKKCEKSLNRSYGEDMERVIALKGSSGWEAALYVRLHLLQGIACYHLGQIEKSKFYLDRAEAELKRLRVSDDQLANLISMGYAPEESRMALRATYGDITTAVDWIIRKREEKAENKAQEAQDLKKRKLQKKLGKCENGELVNVQVFRQLKEMGYSAAFVAESLKISNNDINAAIQLMNDQAFQASVLSQVIDNFGRSEPSTSRESSAHESSAVAAAVANIAELVASLPASATAAGTPLGGLLSSLNPLEVMSNPAIADAVNKVKAALDKSYSEDSLLSPAVSAQDIQRSRKAYESLTKDTCSEAEYIDLGLAAETSYLDKYKTLLQSFN